MLTDLEKKVIASVQRDIPVSRRPYLQMAQVLSISEETFLKTLKGLCDKGFIRRLGATLRHQKSGFTANAMAAWKADEETINSVGRIMASFSQVSHCYRRNPTPEWPYNLYTMIHARDEAGCRETAHNMSQQAGIDDYTLLFSRKELKKTSMEYFPSDEDD